MNERNMWILKNDGLVFQLYQRKYEGERCSCFDPLRGVAGNSRCPICWGTSFIGGYNPSIEIFVRLNLQDTSLMQEQEGYNLSLACNAWTISSIRIQTRDLLYSPEGNIYSVIAVNSHNAAGYWFHQQLRIYSIDQNDPLYTFLRKSQKPAY